MQIENRLSILTSYIGIFVFILSFHFAKLLASSLAAIGYKKREYSLAINDKEDIMTE
jgi:hypothetical protein